MSKFKAGDIVELMSGSDKMTVGKYANEKDILGLPTDVCCTWFDFKNHELKTGTFDENILKQAQTGL
jgi:uncharacterized protein YodC (DUF2158 family)